MVRPICWWDFGRLIAQNQWDRGPRHGFHSVWFQPFDLHRTILMKPRVPPQLTECMINRNRLISLMKSTTAKLSRASIVIRWIGVHEIDVCRLSRVVLTRLEPPCHLGKRAHSLTLRKLVEMDGYKIENPLKGCVVLLGQVCPNPLTCAH